MANISRTQPNARTHDVGENDVRENDVHEIVSVATVRFAVAALLLPDHSERQVEEIANWLILGMPALQEMWKANEELKPSGFFGSVEWIFEAGHLVEAPIRNRGRRFPKDRKASI
jgi:hypothetical protein